MLVTKMGRGVCILLLFAICCSWQIASGARVTVVLLDDRGDMHSFRIASAKVPSGKTLPVSAEFGFQHTLNADIGDTVDIEFIVKGFERFTRKKYGNVIRVDGTVIIISESLFITNTVSGRSSPQALVLPERYCRDSKLRWLEVRKRGKHELAVISRIRDCVVSIGNLDRGIYTGLVVDEGRPTAFGVFGVVSSSVKSKQELKVFPLE